MACGDAPRPPVRLLLIDRAGLSIDARNELMSETLEAEGLTLTLVMRALGPRTAHTPASTPGAAQAGRYDDLTTLGLDLGFSSHSHFTSAFTQAYGRSPSEFRQAVLRRS